MNFLRRLFQSSKCPFHHNNSAKFQSGGTGSWNWLDRIAVVWDSTYFFWIYQMYLIAKKLITVVCVVFCFAFCQCEKHRFVLMDKFGLKSKFPRKFKNFLRLVKRPTNSSWAPKIYLNYFKPCFVFWIIPNINNAFFIMVFGNWNDICEIGHLVIIDQRGLENSRNNFL